LAHAYGYRVIATASPKNNELVKSLGADVVFDYNDTDVAMKCREATEDSIALGVDTIAEGDSFENCIRSFGKDGGKLITLLPPPRSASGWRKDVSLQCKCPIYVAPVVIGSKVANVDDGSQSRWYTPLWAKPSR
jgi:NADPH:quinone reductase-like Zn-dependent oxidoreductase